MSYDVSKQKIEITKNQRIRGCEDKNLNNKERHVLKSCQSLKLFRFEVQTLNFQVK